MKTPSPPWASGAGPLGEGSGHHEGWAVVPKPTYVCPPMVAQGGGRSLTGLPGAGGHWELPPHGQELPRILSM